MLTLYSIRLAMRTVLLSGVKNLKAAFNSLCAYASVNHLHWHLYYLQNHEVKLEKIAAKKISSSGDCYEVSEKDYPAPCYAFQIQESIGLLLTRVLARESARVFARGSN